MIVNTEAALRFLRTAYESEDWIALFLKSYDTGKTLQRVGPLSPFLEPRVHAWLRAMNAQRFNVYVSVNAIQAGRRARTKDAIGTIRHVFLEADKDGPEILATISGRPDLPRPSYVLDSSPGRMHFFWRVQGFSAQGAELLQRQLAREFRTDLAATCCSQTTRIAGYQNHKYERAHLISVTYRDADSRFTPDSFPRTPEAPVANRPGYPAKRHRDIAATERARLYLTKVPPGISGQHGDVHTFRICCRIVRGLDLGDAGALLALAEWNARCVPPWSDRELLAKIAHARKYGREPVGGLRGSIWAVPIVESFHPPTLLDAPWSHHDRLNAAI